jgi:hypothetical protein
VKNILKCERREGEEKMGDAGIGGTEDIGRHPLVPVL